MHKDGSKDRSIEQLLPIANPSHLAISNVFVVDRIGYKDILQLLDL